MNIKDFFELAKSQGYVSYKEFRNILPPEMVDEGQIEDIFNMVNDMGIEIRMEKGSEISDEGDPNDEIVLPKASKEMLEGLNPRELEALKEKFGIDFSTEHSLREVIKQFEVTRERIKQIEQKALKKLRSREKSNQIRCSFCGKSRNEVNRLVASEISTTFICDECIKASTEILDE